jgi:hypothetical protein
MQQLGIQCIGRLLPAAGALAKRELPILGYWFLAGGLLMFASGCGSAETTAISPRFDTSELRVPMEHLKVARAPDTFPVLVDPPVVAAADVDYLSADERVFGVQLDGQRRAYPLRMMTFHHLVNDHLAGKPVLVSYCAFCKSAIAFHRCVSDETIEFGIAGILYLGNMVMFERTSDPGGLWTQLDGSAISGKFAGQTLPGLDGEETTWSDWRSRHPNSTVLAMDRNSERYYLDPRTVRWVALPGMRIPPATRLPDTTHVLGVWNETEARAYVFDRNCAPKLLEDQLNGARVTLEWNPQSNSARILMADSPLRWGYCDWAAWEAFHPDSEVVMCGQIPDQVEPLGR